MGFRLIYPQLLVTYSAFLIVFGELLPAQAAEQLTEFAMEEGVDDQPDVLAQLEVEPWVLNSSLPLGLDLTLPFLLTSNLRDTAVFTVTATLVCRATNLDRAQETAPVDLVLSSGMDVPIEIAISTVDLLYGGNEQPCLLLPRMKIDLGDFQSEQKGAPLYLIPIGGFVRVLSREEFKALGIKQVTVLPTALPTEGRSYDEE